ncbi:MAG: Gfo/Idh/MocA family oxidoreductase, partial [Pseudomonadota bacterium]
MSRLGARAKALAGEASEQTGYPVAALNSLEEVVSDGEVDFAIIATPPNVRADLIEPLARAGKHILLEKPIARTAKESREIVQICANAGVKLGLVFQHRARQASVTAAAKIKRGEFGQLGVAEFNVPWWREQSYYDEPGRGTHERDGGGVLITQAIHTIDLGLSLTGPVRSVLAMAKTTRFHQMESEDFVVAGLEFSNGAAGSLIASTASFPGRPESITLHFDRASLHLEAGQLCITARDGTVETIGEEAGTGGGADPMAFTHVWHQTIIENFVDALNGSAPLLASGVDALAAHELIDATTRSAKSGTAQVLSL